MKMLARYFTARDWDALAARLAPDLVVYDHRPLGWDTLRSPQAYIEMLKVLVDLAPDARTRVDHLRVCERGDLAATTLLGTRDGGPFEDPRVVVAEGDSVGRIRRIDFYTLEQFDAARARFEELRPGLQRSPPPAGLRRTGPADVLDPLHIPANAASRAGDRNQAALEARDWEAVTRACAPTMTFDDRRRSALLTGDRDMFIASSRVMASVGARMSRTLLATAGDRLSLEHHRWTGATDAGAPSTEPFDGAQDQLGTGFEAEIVSLREVDAEGRIVAIIAFDPDDRRTASAEMLERYSRSDDARRVPAAAFEALRAMNAHDLDRVRAALPDDYVFDDHRRTGLGRLDFQGYVASVAALFEQAPSVIGELLYTIAVEEHGLLAMAHSFGTLADGGEFELVYVWLARFESGRLISTELFEPEELHTARARFEDLCAARAT
jgi:ketosteroid isomerase-like protein